MRGSSIYARSAYNDTMNAIHASWIHDDGNGTIRSGIALPECHRRAGDHILLEKNPPCVSGIEPLSSFLRELDSIPQGDAEGLQMLGPPARRRKRRRPRKGWPKTHPRFSTAFPEARNRPDRRGRRYPPRTAVSPFRNSCWIPRSPRSNEFEPGRGCFPAKASSTPKRSVRGSVVAHDQLVGQTLLGGDARRAAPRGEPRRCRCTWRSKAPVSSWPFSRRAEQMDAVRAHPIQGHGDGERFDEYHRERYAPGSVRHGSGRSWRGRRRRSKPRTRGSSLSSAPARAGIAPSGYCRE